MKRGFQCGNFNIFLLLIFREISVSIAANSQYEKFLIFLLLRIYVKSIFGDFRGAKSAILTHLEALNCDSYEFCTFLKAEIYHINHLQSL